LREASRQVKRGLLLHGASGTGKTLTAIHREMSRAGNSVLDRPRETTARTQGAMTACQKKRCKRRLRELCA
jgi:SpoVK/Ycf46/Vps4 family AAA+-type ATPase